MNNPQPSGKVQFLSLQTYLAKNAKFFKFFGITLVVFVGTMLALSSYHQRQVQRQQKKAEAEIQSLSSQRKELDQEILANEETIRKLNEMNKSNRSRQSELASLAKDKRLEYVKTYWCEGMENFCKTDLQQTVEVPQKIEFRTNSQWEAKPLPPTEATLQAFVSHYGYSPHDFIDAGEQYALRPEIIACIARADSDFGQALKTKNNLWNVGNNDRGDTKSFATAKEGIFAIAQTLNNKYLGDKQTVDQLSGQGKGYVYATSPENWDVNVSNCMNRLDKKLG